MRMSGPYHLELVAKDKELVVYVMDHADSKLSVNGGAGKATIQTGKAKDIKPKADSGEGHSHHMQH
jgi:hypothetical protein